MYCIDIVMQGNGSKGDPGPDEDWRIDPGQDVRVPCE